MGDQHILFMSRDDHLDWALVNHYSSLKHAE